jgi:hypothetical protein
MGQSSYVATQKFPWNKGNVVGRSKPESRTERNEYIELQAAASVERLRGSQHTFGG